MTAQENHEYPLWGKQILINFLILRILCLLYLVRIRISIFDQNPGPDYGSFWNATYRPIQDGQGLGV